MLILFIGGTFSVLFFKQKILNSLLQCNWNFPDHTVCLSRYFYIKNSFCFVNVMWVITFTHTTEF